MKKKTPKKITPLAPTQARAPGTPVPAPGDSLTKKAKAQRQRDHA